MALAILSRLFCFKYFYCCYIIKCYEIPLRLSKSYIAYIVVLAISVAMCALVLINIANGFLQALSANPKVMYHFLLFTSLTTYVFESNYFGNLT